MIVSIKFFQPVEIPTGAVTRTPALHATNALHSITVDYPFVKITHTASGASVKATIYNVSYIREEQDAEQPAAPSPPKASRAKAKTDTLV